MYHANVNVDLLEENVIQINGGITINVDVSIKKVMCVKKIMFGSLLHIIICDGVIDADDQAKTFPTNFNEKKVTCKTEKFYILLAFLLITITLLTAVSIYCHLIKY